MNILITNLNMWPFRGTENWCYAIGTELKRRGHNVSIYSPSPRQGIPYFQQEGIDYVTTGTFDLVLDNHCVTYPGIKFKNIIHTCHGTIPAERPLKGAINVAVNERVCKAWKLDTIIKNGIDCERMKPTTRPKDKIETVISLCSSEISDNVLKELCNKLGYNLITTHNKEVFNVNELINKADIAFGVGRSVYDAMACGRPVISFDNRFYLPRMHGCGYVTSTVVANNVDNMTGIDKQWTLDKLIEELKKYNPEDGQRNRDYIMKNLNIKDTVDKYLELIGG